MDIMASRGRNYNLFSLCDGPRVLIGWFGRVDVQSLPDFPVWCSTRMGVQSVLSYLVWRRWLTSRTYDFLFSDTEWTIPSSYELNACVFKLELGALSNRDVLH